MSKNVFEVKFTDPEGGVKLRSEILRPNGMLPFSGIDGEYLDSSFTVGAFDKDKLVSIVTFIKDSNELFSQKNQYIMRALVTDPDYRGQHAASHVVEFGMNELKKRGAELVWFKARVYAIPFYEKNGFETIGEEFMIPGICMHKIMYKEVD